MENSQSSDTLQIGRSQFGLYKFPTIDLLQAGSPLYDRNVHFVEDYRPNFSITTQLGSGVEVNLQLTDYDGNPITNLMPPHYDGLKINESIIPYMSEAGIVKYQIFYDIDLRIVDFVGNDGKFVSPGMLHSLFNHKHLIQRVVGVGQLNEESIEKITNQYGNVVIKPSVRVVQDNDNRKPFYARI